MVGHEHSCLPVVCWPTRESRLVRWEHHRSRERRDDLRPQRVWPACTKVRPVMWDRARLPGDRFRKLQSRRRSLQPKAGPPFSANSGQSWPFQIRGSAASGPRECPRWVESRRKPRSVANVRFRASAECRLMAHLRPAGVGRVLADTRPFLPLRTLLQMRSTETSSGLGTTGRRSDSNPRHAVAPPGRLEGSLEAVAPVNPRGVASRSAS
jgi:hypothetical protein